MPATGMSPKQVLESEQRSMGHGKFVLLRGYETHISRPRISITLIVYWHVDRASSIPDRSLVSLRYALAVDGFTTSSGTLKTIWRKAKSQ